MRHLLLRTIAASLLGLNMQVFCLNMQTFYLYRAVRTLVELQSVVREQRPPAKTGVEAP